MEKAYGEYDSSFSQKQVHTLLPSSSFSDVDREVLLNLYGSTKKIVRIVREWIDNNNRRTYLKICPYCTLSSANSTEHILPKAIYQEYAVHAKNLIPCCTDCNSRKGNKVTDQSGDPEFINFYYNTLPDVQYLFVSITFDANGVVDFSYRLDNVNKIDASLYGLLQRHFKNLNLLERIKTKAITQYTEIENSLLVDMKTKNVDDCMRSLKEKALLDADAYGHNHWSVVLKLALSESDEYKGYLVKRLNY